MELDWTCVTWDADFRHTDTGWSHWSFIGTRWNRIRKPERQDYLKNAYRVLLMVDDTAAISRTGS